MRGPRDAPEIKLEFARRLQAALREKGWSQSDLAEQATKHLPKPERGQKRLKKIGRDSISHYCRGRMSPEGPYLLAISKALDMRPEDLMPAAGFAVPPAGAPFAIRALPDGRMSLAVNRTVTNETAMKIMEIINAEDKRK